MPRKKIAEVLHQVDPHLRIIEAQHRRRKRRTRMSLEDWEKAAGAKCNGCSTETMRLIKGLCPQCAREVLIKTEREIEDEAMRNYYRDQIKRGMVSLSRMRQGLP